MPYNLWSDGDDRPKVRCAHCFQVKNGKKFVKRHFTINNYTVHVEVCDSRCGDLWQQKMRDDYQKMLVFASNG